MLTLAAAETVAGVAGAFTITCTLFGMELAAGVETYKKLSQGVLSNAGAAVVYTTPASTQTFVKSIHLANTSSSAVTGVSMYTKGLLAANRLMGSITIPANGWAICSEDGWRVYDQNGALQTGLVVGLFYKFNSTTSGDPGSGHFGFDNATFSSAATLRISRTTADGFVIASHLQAILNAVPKCTGVLKSTDGSKIFNFTGLGTTLFTDNSTYYSLSITPLLGSSGVANDQAFSAEFFLYGVDGPGVPSGGSNGQFLKKNSGTNYDTVWVNFPARQPILTAAADYYVRPGGSDSHTGTVNSDAFAFLTVQKAIDTVATLDIATFGANIHVADGTFSRALINGPWVGSGTVTLIGNTTTPANCVLDTTALGGSQDAGCVTVQNAGSLTVMGFKCLNSSGNANVPLLISRFGGTLHFTTMNFGVGGRQVAAASLGSIIADGAYTISASATYHWFASLSGSIIVEGRALTLSGTPAFTAFGFGGYNGAMVVDSNSYTGSATGKRFECTAGGGIAELSGSLTALPGNAAGTTGSGTALGWYA